MPTFFLLYRKKNVRKMRTVSIDPGRIAKVFTPTKPKSVPHQIRLHPSEIRYYILNKKAPIELPATHCKICLVLLSSLSDTVHSIQSRGLDLHRHIIVITINILYYIFYKTSRGNSKFFKFFLFSLQSYKSYSIRLHFAVEFTFCYKIKTLYRCYCLFCTMI